MTKKTVLFVIMMSGTAAIFSVLFLWSWNSGRPVERTPVDSAGRPTHRAGAAVSPYQRLLDMEQSEWEALDLPQRLQHLGELIQRYESLPEDDPARGEKFPSVYFWASTLLSRVGRPQEALSMLERADPETGDQAWYHLARGVALEASAQPGPALDAYLNSFSHDASPTMWAKISQFGVPEETTLARIESFWQQRAQPFAPFSLTTPDGEPRRLEDFPGRVLMVTFFFPG